MHSVHRSSSTSTHPKPTFIFPDIVPGANDSTAVVADTDLSPGDSTRLGYSPFLPTTNGAPKEQRWQAQKRDRSVYMNGASTTSTRRTRQKSLSEAIRSIKDRRGSVTENAHEIAEALKAPVSPKLVMLCGFWYMTSIFSNASSKAILTAFRYPVTLTVVQFAFVSSWCIFASYLSRKFPYLKTAIPALKYNIRPPSRELIIATLPLTAFQIGGHILNSDAMARIPVSLVHTIKGLSPLFTVLAYRIFFRVHYSVATYLSLVPLTLGVIMACQSDFSANLIGLLCAFGSAILFVTQNIVSKKLFNEAARAESEGLASFQVTRKPDKLNLLCYSSCLALLFTMPLWLWTEGFGLLHDLFHHGGVELSNRPDRLDSGRLILEFIFNGSFHFAQSLVAFVLLSMISPVTYSVASLIKRVFVVTFAIIWFGNPMTRMQASGIALTFVGLYLYDRTHDAARADRRARLLQSRGEPSLLPLVAADLKKDDTTRGRMTTSPLDLLSGDDTKSSLSPSAGSQVRKSSPAVSQRPNGAGEPARSESDTARKRTSLQNGGPSTPSGGWLTPSTWQESTLFSQDMQTRPNGELVRSESDIARKRGGTQNGGPPISSVGWLPPGTRQESTWIPQDMQARPNGVVI